MNDMARNGNLTVNETAYQILCLLGKGKGGYSYLAERDGVQVVVKQIHHEPCDYYSFGNKIEAELRDYERLHKAGIRIPRMHAVDRNAERIVKDYLDIALTDENGIVHVLDDSMISVTVEGCGTLQGLGTGNPKPEEPYDGNICRSYQGRAQAVIRSGCETGEIRVTIHADGYEDFCVTLKAQ